LARLEQIQPGTRISLGLLVAERMSNGPEELFFLFEDRAYGAREVNERIDNVVRGLISIGVRQGEHVGVLMGSRPSALAALVALSRAGAVRYCCDPMATPSGRRAWVRCNGSSPTRSARRWPPVWARRTRSCSAAAEGREISAWR